MIFGNLLNYVLIFNLYILCDFLIF
jgi:hypothetical protein